MKNMRKGGQLLLGSITVYLSVAMAHGCGGEGPQATGTSSSTRGAGGASTGSASAGSGKGGAGGIMNPVGDAVADSGSRLRAKWLMGEDGSKEFRGWHDKQRDEDCYFSNALDGTFRCLPSAGAVYYYADAACSSPIGIGDATGCAPTTYMLLSSPNTCNMKGHLFTVGSMFNGAMIYVLSGGSCVSTPAPIGVPLISGGAEIPASAFVVATISID